MNIVINILPPEHKKIVRLDRQVRFLGDHVLYVMLLSAILIAGLVALATVLYFSHCERFGVCQKTTYENQGVVAEHHAYFAQINKELRYADRILQQHVRWSDIVEHLSTAITPTIAVDHIDITGTQLRVVGSAQKREDVVILRRAIESVVANNNTVCFADVDVPLSSLVTPENTPFSLTAEITKECLYANKK